ncbi:hypothetical protein GJ496_009432 [Pomphorhynchus laevis]|nr:hypothetical protein GJ496_009432 [Pomphorhynchus laevis]
MSRISDLLKSLEDFKAKMNEIIQIAKNTPQMSELDVDHVNNSDAHDDYNDSQLDDIKQEQYDNTSTIASHKYGDNYSNEINLHQHIQSPFIVQDDHYSNNHMISVDSSSLNYNIVNGENADYHNSSKIIAQSIVTESTQQSADTFTNKGPPPHHPRYINSLTGGHTVLDAINMNGIAPGAQLATNNSSNRLNAALIESLSKCNTSLEQRNLLMRIMPSVYSSTAALSPDSLEHKDEFGFKHLHKTHLNTSTNMQLHHHQAGGSPLHSSVASMESQRTAQLLSQLGVIAAQQHHQQIQRQQHNHHVHHHEHPNDHDCEYCGRNYSNVRKLKRHMSSSHKKEKKYACDDCGKNTYMTRSSKINSSMRNSSEASVSASVVSAAYIRSTQAPTFKTKCDEDDIVGCGDEYHQQTFSSLYPIKDKLLSAIITAAAAPEDNHWVKNKMISNTESSQQVPHCRNIISPSQEQVRNNSSTTSAAECTRDLRLNSAKTESEESISMGIIDTFQVTTTNADKTVSDMGVQVDFCSHPSEYESLSMDDLLARYVAQGRLFKCRHCDTYFKERGIYSMHAVLHGDECPWQCSVCGRKMNDRNEFTLHFVNQQHHCA